MTIIVQTDHDAILAAICAEPLDPLHRAAMYNYWKEKGDALRLEAWRALEGKYPEEDRFYWWYASKRRNGRDACTNRPDHSALPGYKWVAGMLDDSSSSGEASILVFFKTPARAFTEAVESYVRLKGRGLI